MEALFLSALPRCPGSLTVWSLWGPNRIVLNCFLKAWQPTESSPTDHPPTKSGIQLGGLLGRDQRAGAHATFVSSNLLQHNHIKFSPPTRLVPSHSLSKSFTVAFCVWAGTSFLSSTSHLDSSFCLCIWKIILKSWERPPHTYTYTHTHASLTQIQAHIL